MTQQQLLFPLLLVVIISKSSLQNDAKTAKAFGANKRTDRAATYREHFETFGAAQSAPAGEMDQELATQRQQRQQREGNAGGDKPRSKTRYMEFAETEFSRPSIYLPVPFVTPADNQLQEISGQTLSQLIKQHVARNRIKQLAQQTPPYLRSAQSRVKELRQTLFRRWPTNSTVLSYAEKRRQWKTELKRRLEGRQKVRTRIIPPILISGGSHSSTQTDTEPRNRYYVTYSPQTRTYQVSRHPPPYLYTTDQDALPQQLDEESPPQQQVAVEPPTPPLMATDGSVVVSTTAEEPSSGEEHFLPTPSKESATTTSTTISPPLLVVLQNAELMSDAQRHNEHSQQVEATRKEAAIFGQKPLPLVKQILFLDDYEQVQGDEEGEGTNDVDNDGLVTVEQPTNNHLVVSKTGGGIPTVPSEMVDKTTKEMPTMERQTEENGTEEEEPQFEEEENEDEDMFFFKPGGRSGEGRAEQQNGAAGRRDPFRIVVHETGKKL